MPYSELPNLLASLSSTFIGARLPVPLSPHLWPTIRFLAFTVDRRRYCGACGDGSPLTFAHPHSGSIPFVQVLGLFHPAGIILDVMRPTITTSLRSSILCSLVLHPHSSLSPSLASRPPALYSHHPHYHYLSCLLVRGLRGRQRHGLPFVQHLPLRLRSVILFSLRI